jgi:hypothetical protein
MEARNELTRLAEKAPWDTSCIADAWVEFDKRYSVAFGFVEELRPKCPELPKRTDSPWMWNDWFSRVRGWHQRATAATGKAKRKRTEKAQTNREQAPKLAVDRARKTITINRKIFDVKRDRPDFQP